MSSVLKRSLYDTCTQLLKTQILELKQSLASIEEARNNETKSSVGDKYETGRAMMQQEYQKVSQQLARIQSQLSQLKSIALDMVSTAVKYGSLVATDNGVYFISVPLGKVELEGTKYFCITLESPIGRLLHKKSKGDTISFHGKAIQILSIS